MTRKRAKKSAKKCGKRKNIICGEEGPTLVGLNKELGRWISKQHRTMKANAKKVKKRIHGQLVDVTVCPPADVTGRMLGEGRETVRPTSRGTKFGVALLLGALLLARGAAADDAVVCEDWAQSLRYVMADGVKRRVMREVQRCWRVTILDGPAFGESTARLEDLLDAEDEGDGDDDVGR